MAKGRPGSIDAAGALLVAALLAVGIWSVVRQAPGTSRRIRTAQADLTDARSAQRAGEVAVARLQGEVAALADDIRRRGSPTAPSAAEENLHAVAQLARTSEFELVRVTPLPPQVYPGLTELRFALEGRGSFTAWQTFLASFEAAPFWADLTHVRIGAELATNSADETPQHAISFTLSLFAAEAPAKGS